MKSEVNCEWFSTKIVLWFPNLFYEKVISLGQIS